MKWFAKYRRNTYSQGGEDGYIDLILDVLDVQNGWCVDIGAWDGKAFSNIYAQIENRGFSAVMIEGDRERYEGLKKTAAKNDKIIPVCCEVTPDNADGLLKRCGSPRVLLNIDIDGGEAEIWRKCPPFLIAVIEWQDRGEKHPWPVLAAGEDLGYVPFAATNANIIFLLRKSMQHLWDQMVMKIPGTRGWCKTMVFTPPGRELI